MQGAGVRKTRKRFWPAGEDAGRRPKPVRICEANTRILRAKPQPKTHAMFIESQPAMRRINGTPNPRRIELCAGRGRKENASVTQSGTRFPNGHPTETASQNIGSEWDAFSGWVVGGKFIPESSFGMGCNFQMNG